MDNRSATAIFLVYSTHPMTKTKSLLAAALTSLVLVGGGCTSTQTSEYSAGPFAAVATQTIDDQVQVTIETTRGAKAEDFYDESKLPMAAEAFYAEDPTAGLGKPTKTYADEDGDMNRLYAVKGGSLATIEIDGDPLSIVEYRPDNLLASDFLSADLREQLPASGTAFVVVHAFADDEDILFIVELKDGKVMTVSP